LATDSSPLKRVSLPPEDAQKKVSQFMKNLQDEICAKLEEVDGQSKFREYGSQREEGGGRSRVLCDGDVLEQGGVNLLEV
jgi:coproporphyrinogen III oxidase